MAHTDFGLAISEEVLGENAPVPLQGGILEAMEAAAALGFDSVELHVRDPHTLDAKAIATRAKNLGIRVAAIGTGLENSRNGHCLTDPDPARRQAAREAMFRHIDFAGAFGAVVFVGLIRGSAPERAAIPARLDLFAEELALLQAKADEVGVPTGLEPVAYYFSNLLNTTAETVDFLQRPGLDTVGLLIDTHHIALEDPSQRDAFEAAGPRITHVHASDSNRRYPGAGNIDWTEVLSVLDQLGYEGSISLEVLPVPDGPRAAARGLGHLQEVASLLEARPHQ